MASSERASGVSFTPPLGMDKPSSRNRPFGRSATSSTGAMPLNRRRSSFFSDSLSDTHRSLKMSTDDLLLPRVNEETAFDHLQDQSHWHSVPLGLALLPAVGGLFFKNGSAIFTDLSLLVLAGVFLNWSVRLPWDWYVSAQQMRPADPYSLPAFDTIIEELGETVGENNEHDEAIISSPEITPPQKRSASAGPGNQQDTSLDVPAARKELHIHEILALLACFVCPAVGAWLLHAIRAQLSRPSEGLVSNYNLTVFLLASEIRPMSHLVKMIQARTLFLQRVVRSEGLQNEEKVDNGQIIDVMRRLAELEAHIADKAESANNNTTGSTEMTVAKASAQASTELRKTFQPELDALNRAVRRYEKRTTISAIQTESRLQDIETRLKDVVVLAAAAQRNADNQPQNFVLVLVNWFCAMIVIPVQCAIYVSNLPSRALSNLKALLSRYFGSNNQKIMRESRSSKLGGMSRPRDRKQKSAS